jgi:hypothetical protein
VRRSQITKPPGNPTGHSLPGCYASALRDCSPQLSREHYISKALLERLSQVLADGRASEAGILVSGFPWLPGDRTKNLAPEALVAKVLCDRHNGALSGLDTVSAQVLRAFDEIDAAVAPRAVPTNRLYIFNGHDIERWLLKVLCGLIASRSVTAAGGRGVSDIPAEWISALYGGPFGDGQGLYVPKVVGETRRVFRGVHAQAVVRDGRSLGMFLVLNARLFVLTMAPDADWMRDNLERTCHYRPSELHMTGHASEHSVLLTWSQPGAGGILHLRHTPNAPA